MRTAVALGIAVLVPLGGLAACGASGECSPDCRPGFTCYYGTCVPEMGDAGETATDGDGGPPPDDGAGDRLEVRDARDVGPDGTCVTAADCADGDPCSQDLCDPATGICYHPEAPDGTPCTDDGDPCTRDVCTDGYCTHPPGTCCTSAAECADDDPCTADDCVGGACVHEEIPDCCIRDADCMWPDHIWECDPASMSCYDPPGGEFCARCSTRRDCGDGGESSDDWCVYYTGYGGAGCSKDCIDDADCPGGALCWASDGGGSGHPCDVGEDGCFCVVRVGTCESFNLFGSGCESDASCDLCDGCEVLVCHAGYCTWPCEVPADCPWGSACEGSICVRG